MEFLVNRTKERRKQSAPEPCIFYINEIKQNINLKIQKIRNEINKSYITKYAHDSQLQQPLKLQKSTNQRAGIMRKRVSQNTNTNTNFHRNEIYYRNESYYRIRRATSATNSIEKVQRIKFRGRENDRREQFGRK